MKMKNTFITITAIIIVLLIDSCAIPIQIPDRAKMARENSRLEKYIGQTAKSIIFKFGTPDKDETSEKSGRVLTYKRLSDADYSSYSLGTIKTVSQTTYINNSHVKFYIGEDAVCKDAKSIRQYNFPLTLLVTEAVWIGGLLGILAGYWYLFGE